MIHIICPGDENSIQKRCDSMTKGIGNKCMAGLVEVLQAANYQIFYIHVLVFPSKHFLSISKLFYHFGNNHEMVLSQVDITMLPCSDRDPSRILSMPSLLRAFLCIIEAAEFIRCHSISS